jgi:hypothetical protein
MALLTLGTFAHQAGDLATARNHFEASAQAALVESVSRWPELGNKAVVFARLLDRALARIDRVGHLRAASGERTAAAR